MNRETRCCGSIPWNIQHSSAQSCLTLCYCMDCLSPCSSPTRGVYLKSCPLSQCCDPTISSCFPFLLPPSIFPSITVFSSESALCIRWPNTGVSASTSVLPMNTQDWSPLGWTGCYLLAVQGTLKSLLQHHTSKASIFWRSAFFIVQLSHPYITTGKSIALTRWNFVGKVMSLLFNMLSRLVITYLQRSKHLLISWLQSPSAVILKPPK